MTPQISRVFFFFFFGYWTSLLRQRNLCHDRKPQSRAVPKSSRCVSSVVSCPRSGRYRRALWPCCERQSSLSCPFSYSMRSVSACQPCRARGTIATWEIPCPEILCRYREIFVLIEQLGEVCPDREFSIETELLSRTRLSRVRAWGVSQRVQPSHAGSVVCGRIFCPSQLCHDTNCLYRDIVSPYLG